MSTIIARISILIWISDLIILHSDPGDLVGGRGHRVDVSGDILPKAMKTLADLLID